ncbi:hypothetical protein Xmau_01639 [Xenorhabdus mauleonii]|uniref:Uncharacterized protein n=1 Tax=Xenorhabdus mauleonii TaxID=351675 RepID=A0A1I3P414_9GAMM|nr:hypothetical protein [Xenorhabdus mauleonii]PHM44924.1 hypothetical protein Xmau_01639 [Xenorhabdus mauleonii]SFJ16132.1 hypothetical protein SAMN05421680_10622 [Xenorhabdus mauleonii]
MDGAKDIAESMVSTITDNDSGFFSGVATGLLDVPVDLFYLGYDFLDTEHRYENENDKYRFAYMIKANLLSMQSIERVIQIIFEEYFDKLSDEQKRRLVETKVGSILGGMVGKQVIFGGHLGAIFGSRWLTKFAGSTIALSVVSVGSSVSRAIYTSRDLAEKNPELYMKLRREGDLDLLYFLVENKMNPYVKAIENYSKNRELFDTIFDEFVKKLE